MKVRFLVTTLGFDRDDVVEFQGDTEVLEELASIDPPMVEVLDASEG
jgi:hypothetical protein